MACDGVCEGVCVCVEVCEGVRDCDGVGENDAGVCAERQRPDGAWTRDVVT